MKWLSFTSHIVNDPLERIRGRLTKCQDLDITMMVISNDIADSMEHGKLSESTTVNWLNIWKELFKRVPKTMNLMK